MNITSCTRDESATVHQYGSSTMRIILTKASTENEEHFARDRAGELRRAIYRLGFCRGCAFLYHIDSNEVHRKARRQYDARQLQTQSYSKAQHRDAHQPDEHFSG